MLLGANRGDGVIRAKRNLIRYTKKADTDKLAMFIASWYGHLSFTDSRNLINHIQGVYQWKLVKNH